MKKKALWLFLAGNLCMSLSIPARHFIPLTDFTDGFIKGAGIGLLILALIVQKRSKRTCRQ